MKSTSIIHSKTIEDVNIYIHVFVLAFTIVQLYLPLRYYLFNDDPLDERFAWRMFSEIAMSGKEIEFWAEMRDSGLEVPIDHESFLGDHWTSIVLRGKRQVVDNACSYFCREIEKARSVHAHFVMYKWEGGVYETFHKAECME